MKKIFFLALILALPGHAYKVMLSPGAASNTTDATTKSLWPYSAANVEGAKYGGTWSNNVYTPSAARTTIVGNFTTTISQTESVVFNGDNLESNGDYTPPSWIANRTLPTNFTSVLDAGGTVQYMNLYNANTRSYNTPAELADIKAIFDENGVPSSGINFGTIIRSAGGGYQSFLQPYGHFLFEIRTDTVLNNSTLQDAVINTTIWGLDNGKTVFLQILPQVASKDFEFDMRTIMQILRTRIGATRFQNPNLWLVLASYDESEYDTRLAPETLNGANHFNTLTGVAKTLLESRTAFHNGDFSYPRSEFTLEAESASSQGNFTPWETVTESGTTFIVWPGTGLVNGGLPNNFTGVAHYNFTTSTAGNVALEASVKLADDASDSFWYKINDSPWKMERDQSGGGLKWIGLGRYPLEAGNHVLEIARRRGNAKIDKFRFATVTGAVTATPPTPPLVASAGRNQIVYDYDANGSEIITLDASQSAVTTGTITSYVWKKGATQIATGIQPSVNLTTGVHILTLTVTSSSNATATSNVTITIRSNDGKIVVENSTESILDTGAFGEYHSISNFKVGNGVGRKLVVTVGAKGIGILSLKYGGKSLTLAKEQNDGTTHASIWYLDNPPIGTADLVQSGGAARGSSLGVLSLQNAAPGAAFTAGISDRKITYTTPTANTLIVGAYTDSYENAGPSAPQVNKFVTSGGWGGSALAGWELITNAGSRSDTYRASTTKPVAIATVGFIAASPKMIEAESALGQPNLSPFIQQTDPDTTSYLIVPGGTGNVNAASVTVLSGIAAYPFNLTTSADVAIDARVLFSNFSNDTFWHRVDGGTWTRQQGLNGPGWQWIPLATYPALAAGNHLLEIVRAEDSGKFDQFRLTPSGGSLSFVAPPPVHQTYGNGGTPGTGNPWLISDSLTTRIEAENYDQGAEGESYHDTTAGNTGGAYRSDGVDLQAITGNDGGTALSYVVNGEWLKYTVNVARTTSYTLNVRVARQTTGTGLIRVLFNGVDKTGSLIVPNTGNWQSYVDLPITVKLDAGQQEIRLEMLSSNFNLNYFELTPQVIPAPWQHAGIGTVAAVGDALYNANTFTVIGSGGDIFGQGDRFHYAWQPAYGDCELITRVTAMDNTNAGAKAGVMIRETLDSNSRQFSIFITPGQGIVYQQRVVTGGFTAATTATGLTAPYWLKIKRAGNLFTSSYSVDGITWTALGTQGFLIDKNAYIGLAVTSKNDGTLNAATFDNVTVTANTAPNISDIDDQTIAANANTGALAFEVDDLQSSASLTVTATSSNATLVPAAKIILGGTGTNRTVTITPLSSQLGTTTITLTVSDGSLTALTTFTLTVEGTPQQSWRYTYFGTTANAGNAADSFDLNGDGENNFLEFATGQSPSAHTITDTPLVLNGANLEFTYTRSKAAMADGITFSVEWSDFLTPNSWSTSNVAEEILTNTSTIQTIKATLPAGANGKRFVHLRSFKP